jgi:antitoxin CptB
MKSAEHLRVAPAASEPWATLTPTELNRLRWRCRRGMLENDLVLTRFLDERGAELTTRELQALDRLLALADDALWDLLCGRCQPQDEALVPLVAALRRA